MFSMTLAIPSVPLIWVATHNNHEIVGCGLTSCVCSRVSRSRASFRAFREQLLHHPSLSPDLRWRCRTNVSVEGDYWVTVSQQFLHEPDVTSVRHLDYQRLSNRGNTRKMLEMLAECFVYDPTPAKAETSGLRDQPVSDESFPGSVEVGVAMTPRADIAPGPSEFDLGYYGWRVMLAACLGVMAGFGALFVYPFSLFVKPLAADFGWNREAISSGFAIAAVTLGVISPLLGRWIDRFGPRRIILACMTTYGCAMPRCRCCAPGCGSFM